MPIITNLFPIKHAHTAFVNKNSSLDNLFKNTNFIHMNQVHSNNISIITKPQKNQISKTDAVITNTAGLSLVVRTADCMPILIHHKSGVIAAIHAGRRGTQQNILYKTLDFMSKKFNINSNCNLFIDHTCTLEDKNYFSYRQTGKGVEMNYAVITLKK